MQRFSTAIEAHIDLPGMNVLVKRSTDAAIREATGCIPVDLERVGNRLVIVEGGSRRERLTRSFTRATLPGRLGYEGMDVIVTLPQSIRRCTWTRKTHVRHEAYRLTLLHTDVTETTIDLPDWPTLLVAQKPQYQSSIFVYSRLSVSGTAGDGSVFQPRITQGEDLQYEGRSRCIYFPPERAIDELVDGYAAVVHLPNNARVLVRKGTPYTNGLPGNSAAEVIVE